MKNIRLYIGGKRADLDGSLNIPFTYQTSDSQMPTAVKNSYSKTVTLQGTEQNRRIFDGLWRLDSRVKDVKAREPEYIEDYTETDAEFTSRAVPSAAQGNLVKATGVKGDTIVSGDELVNNAATGVETLSAGGTSLGTLSTPITEIVPADKPTVRLNQLVQNGDFSQGTTGWLSSSATISAVPAGLQLIANGASAAFVYREAVFTIGNTHKYFLEAVIELAQAGRVSFSNWNSDVGLIQVRANVLTKISAVWTPNVTAGSGRRGCLALRSLTTNNPAAGDSMIVHYFQIIDLTEMYGAGNEPTSTAEVEELIGADYIPYNTGEDIPNRIFPKGMKSAGSVADEWSGTTAVKRVGVVDLGTATWQVVNASIGVFNIVLSDKRRPTSTSNVGNLVCAGYIANTGDYVVSASMTERMMQENPSYPTWVMFKNTSFNGYTAAQVKAAMSGVYLYYELATPVTYTTDQALPDTFAEFDKGGTMRRLPVDTESSVLAPFVGSFEYGHIQTYPLPYHFNPMKRVPFLLYVDEMVVERGYCQLVAINRKSRGYTFSLSLFGGLGEFFYNLQTDADGETKSLADLDFGQDLGFTINAAKVQEVWDDLIAGNLPTIGFVPMHNGAPASVDGKKALIKGGGLPTSIIDGSDTYSQKLGYILASLERKYTEWEIGDLRSYLQRPALRFKDFLAAVCNPANNGGWTVNLDSGFFNEDNPYYEKTYLLLPQLNVEESTDEICDDGSVQAVSDYPTTATKVKTLQPVSSCLTLDGTYIDLSGSASNAYVKVSLPIQLAVTGLTNQGDLYLTNRVSHHTENKTICMMAAAYDEGGSLLAVSNRYVFTSKSHRNETGDVKKPAAPVATTDAQIDGYFTYQGGEYVFRTDDNAANIFALVIDKIPRPSSSAHKIQVRFYIQMTTDGIPTLNTKRKGENSSNVNVSNTQFSCRILEGSNNNVSLVEPTQYASDSRVTQEALLNSLEQSPLEILLSYTKTFGLMWIQDNLQNSVSLYKRENYYTGEVSDIHNRIDYGKGWKATPVSAESNNYTLENEYPETTLSKAYESDYGRTYGGVRLKVGYDFGKEKIETMEKVDLKGYVEGALSGSGYWKYRNADGNLPSPIADGMKVTYYKESGGETQTKDVEYNLFNVTAITKTNSPALGVACLNEDGEEKAVEVAPALVMLQGGAMGGTFYLSDDVAAMATLNNGPCWIWDESRAVARIPRFARVATFDGETYSLDFGTPRMTYYIPEVSLAPEQAVYARYWEKYLTDLLDRNTKKVECFVVFPPHLDMRQEMRKFYLFDRTLWVLNKVTDYDATKEQSVKCEFIRVNLKGNYVNE